MRIPFVGDVLFARFNHIGFDFGQGGDVGYAPGLGANGQVKFTEENDRAVVFQGNAYGLTGCEEALGWGGGCDDGNGEFTMLAVITHEQVTLLCFGGQTCAGAASLNVADHHGELRDGRQSHKFGF